MPLCIRNRSLSDFDFYIVRCVLVHTALFLSHTTFWFRLVYFLYISLILSHLAPKIFFLILIVIFVPFLPPPPSLFIYIYVCVYVYIFHSFSFLSCIYSSLLLSSRIYSNFSVLIKVLSVSIFYLYMLYICRKLKCPKPILARNFSDWSAIQQKKLIILKEQNKKRIDIKTQFELNIYVVVIE